VQAAGLKHPSEIDASHIVRRGSEHGVKLLANLLPFVKPGSLLEGDMSQQVFRTYWPMAEAASFKRVSAFEPVAEPWQVAPAASPAEAAIAAAAYR
jgi:hypothetical protein